jgi:cytoskeletal protein RodZ
MTRDQHLTSFGLYLQTARIDKKLSIEALSAEIRIRTEVLKQLEAEEYEHLPNVVFVKGFIRSYAQAVGADVEEALKRYDAHRALRAGPPDRKASRATLPDRFWLRLVAAVGAVLLMAGMTLYLYTRLTAPPALPEKRPALPVEEKATSQNKPLAAQATAPSTPVNRDQETMNAPKEATAADAQYTLDIKAVEETWLKIIVDDQNAQELTLKTGETAQVKATALFNLLIGNAGGVELKLNGAPVSVSGKSGQVVNIQLP